MLDNELGGLYGPTFSSRLSDNFTVGLSHILHIGSTTSRLDYPWPITFRLDCRGPQTPDWIASRLLTGNTKQYNLNSTTLWGCLVFFFCADLCNHGCLRCADNAQTYALT